NVSVFIRKRSAMTGTAFQAPGYCLLSSIGTLTVNAAYQNSSWKSAHVALASAISPYIVESLIGNIQSRGSTRQRPWPTTLRAFDKHGGTRLAYSRNGSFRPANHNSL